MRNNIFEILTDPVRQYYGTHGYKHDARDWEFILKSIYKDKVFIKM